MHLLSGIGACCSSTEKVESLTRRDSSISLEDGAYKRHTPEPAKPLTSFDLEIFEEPGEHGLQCGRTLPTPSLASSPSVIAPMDVYLRCEESHESRLMRLSGTALQHDSPSKLDISPAETCSWEFIDGPAQIPNTPVLQPALSPKSTGISSNKSSHAKRHKKALSGSDMSELALSVDSQSLSDDTETYKEAVAEYKAASKRYQNAGSKAPKRPRVYKGLKGPRRRGEKRKADDK